MFKTWLRQYKLADSPIGDIANDILRDKSFPNSSDYKVLTSYIKSKTKDNDVLEAFRMAYELYCDECNKKNDSEEVNISLVLKVGVNSTLDEKRKPVYYGEYTLLIPRLAEIKAIRKILDYYEKNDCGLFDDCSLAWGIVDVLEGQRDIFFEKMKNNCPEIYYKIFSEEELE
jgi:uncharacterized protein YozE (UPF0346 family)